MKTLLLIFFSFSSIFAQTEITPRLRNVLNNARSDDYIKVLVLMKDQSGFASHLSTDAASSSSVSKNLSSFIPAFKENAKLSQSDLLGLIEKRRSDYSVKQYDSFWIADLIALEAKRDFINELLLRNDIAIMDVDAILKNEEITEQRNSGLKKITGSVEPGIKIINADKLWQLGITGKGRLVMNIDTGVDGDHPALKDKWRGRHVPSAQAWYDPKNHTSLPYDSVDHGTHTMGLMLGSSKLTGDTVGVALDAEWIASNALTGGNPHTSRTIAAFQWALDPDGNPSTSSDMPDVINCSWYDGDTTLNYCDNNNIYKQVLDAVEAAGIAVVFSAGNSGAKPQTISNPQNINTSLVNTFCVANIDGTKYLQGNLDPVYANSSRGPSRCGGNGALLIKPEVSAPGTYVRSSVPGGKYAEMPGTSMAAAYVSGAVALLRQSNPEKTGSQIKLALYYSAKDLGELGEDNIYGRGLIDLYAAFKYLNPPDSIAPTKISDLKITNATSNSLELHWSAPLDSTKFGVRRYDLRYSTSPINTVSDFNSSQVVQIPDTPKAFKELEQKKICGLNPNTSYYFAIRSVDLWGNWSDVSNVASSATLKAPQVIVNRDSIYREISGSQPSKDVIIIRNSAPYASTLDYSLEFVNRSYPVNSISNHSGAAAATDSSKYIWIDSDNPNGPVYQWNDINTTASEVSPWVAIGPYDPKDEGYAGPVSIGFNFPFYGRQYNQLFVTANGLISFEQPAILSNSNTLIPNFAAPNCFIAPFWDDMDGKQTGKIFTKQENDKFIIQYSNWSRRSANTGALTAQVVLTNKGKIFIYYNSVPSISNSATLGIENQDGSKGLQIAFNQSYFKDKLAIEILKEPEWLKILNSSGTLISNTENTIEIEYNLPEIENGDYSGDLVVRTNDPLRSFWTIPVSLKARNLSAQNDSKAKLQEFNLSQNYPNPFNPETVISFSLAEKNLTTLKIYDLLGREVAVLVNEIQEKGIYKVGFNSARLSSGTYIYRLVSGKNSMSRKMMVVR